MWHKPSGRVEEHAVLFVNDRPGFYNHQAARSHQGARHRQRMQRSEAMVEDAGEHDNVKIRIAVLLEKWHRIGVREARIIIELSPRIVLDSSDLLGKICYIGPDHPRCSPPTCE